MKRSVQFLAACAAMLFTSSAWATDYTWSGAGEDGAWTNAANWRSSSTASYGYPNFTYSTIAFAAGTTNVVKFDAARTIQTIVIDGADTVVRFEQGGAGTNETKMTVSASPTFTGAGSQLILDNVALAFGNFRVDIGSGFTLKLTNGADALFTGSKSETSLYSSGRIEVEGESMFNVTSRSYLQKSADGVCLVINNARYNVGSFYYIGTDLDDKVIFRGDHPELYVKGLFYGVSDKAALTFEFEVPREGYAKAPIYTVSNGRNMGCLNNGSAYCGSSAAFAIADSSPARGEVMTMPLVSWPTAGIYRSFAKEGHLTHKRDKFLWKDAEGNVMADDASGYPVSLDVCLNPAFPGFMLILR